MTTKRNKMTEIAGRWFFNRTLKRIANTCHVTVQEVIDFIGADWEREGIDDHKTWLNDRTIHEIEDWVFAGIGKHTH